MRFAAEGLEAAPGRSATRGLGSVDRVGRVTTCEWSCGTRAFTSASSSHRCNCGSRPSARERSVSSRRDASCTSRVDASRADWAITALARAFTLTLWLVERITVPPQRMLSPVAV